MNLVYAEVMQIFTEDGQRMARVRVNGLMKTVPLVFVPEAEVGDEVLLCDGVPLGKSNPQKKGGNYVSGNSGKSA